MSDSTGEPIAVSGTVENVIYFNEDNGYTVFDVSCDEGSEGVGEIVTVFGSTSGLNVGEKIRLEGEWSFSKSYGRQLKLLRIEIILPTEVNDILRYLKSSRVKGIGPKTAERLVEQYGEDTFEVIENHPEWLAKLPGVSQKKAEEISEAFRAQHGVRLLMMYCRDFLTAAMSSMVYKKWGNSSIDMIGSNPYRLCEEFTGIGFERADRLAQSMGIKPDSEFRIMSGIRYVLGENARSGGHSFLPYKKLCAASAATLGVTETSVCSAIEKMIGENRLIRCDISGLDAVFDRASYVCEQNISSKLLLLDRLCAHIDAGDVERFILRIEVEEGKHYASLQRRAIAAAVNSGVMILTGGPGTGKTTVIRAVIRIFESLDMTVALAAPTGRAAKRMSEATQCEARTIHRLLEMEYSGEGDSGFKKNANDLLDEDVIIVDEASMIDMRLMDSLLEAIKPGARLMLIGDSDQLPSVGAGNVLNDLIACEKFCTVKLTEIFRQAQESLIITNAHRINEGTYPILNSKSGDFFFLPRKSDEEIAATIVDLCLNRLPKSYGEEIAEGIQVISPSRRGVGGTENLNRRLKEALNPPSPRKLEKSFRDVVFREGDRVMQIKNDYDLIWEKDGKESSGVFNGDIGVIETINPAEEYMVISFEDRVVKYDFAKLDELEHAYAITVHKSQGSEYPFVVMPMYGSCPIQLLSRNLLYTGVTRAQRMVILVGDPAVVCRMVDNNRQVMRYTGLMRHE